MSMNTEELSTKFAVMENQLGNLMDATVRIENSIIKLGTLDKTMSEIVVSNTYMHQKVVDLEKDSGYISLALNTANGEITKAQGAVTSAKYLLSAFAFIAACFFGYLFNTAQDNKRVNIQQTEQIEYLKHYVERNIRNESS